MKLDPDFILHMIGEETVLVPVGQSAFSGMVRGNKTLGAVLELLRSETTEEKLVADMSARFSAPEGVIEKDVRDVLTQLRSIGALDESQDLKRS